MKTKLLFCSILLLGSSATQTMLTGLRSSWGRLQPALGRYYSASRRLTQAPGHETLPEHKEAMRKLWAARKREKGILAKQKITSEAIRDQMAQLWATERTPGEHQAQIDNLMFRYSRGRSLYQDRLEEAQKEQRKAREALSGTSRLLFRW